MSDACKMSPMNLTKQENRRRQYGKKRYKLNPAVAQRKRPFRKLPDYRNEEYTGKQEFD